MTKARGEARKAAAIGNRLAPWRFLLFLAVLIAGYFAYRAIWPSATWSDGVAMAFDANNGYTAGGAIRVGRALEELGFWWFEEPVQHYHPRAMGEVARALDITVSAVGVEKIEQAQALYDMGCDLAQGYLFSPPLDETALLPMFQLDRKTAEYA